ncbi:MAG TPA: PIG-L family deacetylase, partial [bacterium]|nr:PIG-L family deacetylase [bacterium]
RAFRYRSIFGYELPWNNISFPAEALIRLTTEQLAIKSEAISCYKSQGFRHYSQPEFFQAQASVRGVQYKRELAEAFEVIRLML